MCGHASRVSLCVCLCVAVCIGSSGQESSTETENCVNISTRFGTCPQATRFSRALSSGKRENSQESVFRGIFLIYFYSLLCFRHDCLEVNLKGEIIL